MAIQTQGFTGSVAEVDLNNRAFRTSIRPTDHGANGVFRMSVQTGTMAAGTSANTEIFQFRWTDASHVAIVERVVLDGFAAIAAFTAGVAILNLNMCRSWTVDGSGGTTVTTSLNSVKVRTSHAASLLGSARIASTGALTAGTKTVEATSIGSVVGGMPATAGAAIGSSGFIDVMPGGHPIILSANEGFVIRSTVPLTGTWTAGITVHWTEASAY